MVFCFVYKFTAGLCLSSVILIAHSLLFMSEQCVPITYHISIHKQLLMVEVKLCS